MAANNAPETPGGGVSRGYARYALGLLLLVYVINYVDRQVLSILVEPIRTELGLTDTQIGLLSGLGFALFYAAAGLPIARLADRTSRKGIIAGCLALWSGATALCGLAMNFPQLLVARALVAVGEAGAGPAGHSMLADIFPHGKRATALAVFSCGVPIGILVGLLAGGWLAQTFDWRTAFIVVGLPGVLVAIVVALTLKEPPRGGEASAEPPLSTREALRTLMRIPAFNFLVLGSALHAFTSYGALQWNPAFMIRFHGLSTAEAGLALGLISGVTGVVGTLAGGWFADLLGRRDNRWYAWLPALMIAVRAPLFISAYLAPTPALAIALLILPGFLGNSFTGPVFGTIQTLAPAQTRAFASAWTLFIIALVGFGLGPLVIGVTSDALAPAFGNRSLGYAIALAAIGEVVSVIFFLMAARRLPRNSAAPAGH
ncbi:MFS transporter [Phenylobacterium sp.]|uniref:spinster family MFS transporter n=1 Tax=Phenylobacterium sp. TaxID=1871053 RepID=UPI00301D446E